MVSLDGYEAYAAVTIYAKSCVHFLFDGQMKGCNASMTMLEHGSFNPRARTSEAYTIHGPQDDP